MMEGMIALLAAVASQAPADGVAQPAIALTDAEIASQTLATATDRVMRMTVPTSVNGKGPYAFTIDTAANRSVVSDRLASELALPAGAIVTVHGLIGPQPVRTVTVDRLKVGSRERRGVATPVLSERSLGTAGLLGVDALKDQAVILDFKRRLIVMTRSEDDNHDPETIVVTGRSRFGQLILTDARIDGRKIYAIIDTGAECSVANLEMRRLLEGSNKLEPDNAIIGVTGAELPAENGVIPKLRLGGLHVTNMPIVFADAHTFRKFGVDNVPAVLVGMDVLRRFDRVAVDFRRRQVRFLVGDGGALMAAAGKGAAPGL